ncbi:hypothetical protein PoB_002986300 [Plakobranchus ocellatus]|uniref:Uncharacterized protein n=1 Tax=Plakobranchus ocellatus TaxID=259542 RepID=A0AAV4A9P2_9GAST|nr:hypothetical protein PoB_002986300 [Plakobranchus ocellatus]
MTIHPRLKNQAEMAGVKSSGILFISLVTISIKLSPLGEILRRGSSSIVITIMADQYTPQNKEMASTDRRGWWRGTGILGLIGEDVGEVTGMSVALTV